MPKIVSDINEATGHSESFETEDCEVAPFLVASDCVTIKATDGESTTSFHIRKDCEMRAIREWWATHDGFSAEEEYEMEVDSETVEEDKIPDDVRSILKLPSVHC